MAIESPQRPPPLVDSASRVIDRTLVIVQQELELARLELVEKLPAFGRGLIKLALSVMLVVFGAILAVLALIWALAAYVFGFDHVWASFALVAAVFLFSGVYLAIRTLRRAREIGPPVPSAAVRQARALADSVRR